MYKTYGDLLKGFKEATLKRRVYLANKWGFKNPEDYKAFLELLPSNAIVGIPRRKMNSKIIKQSNK
jgi:hypothetical protein